MSVLHSAGDVGTADRRNLLQVGSKAKNSSKGPGWPEGKESKKSVSR